MIADDLMVAQGRWGSTYSISGGSVDVGDITFGTGKGTFAVDGSGASAISADSYTQNDISTLKVVLDSGGVTPITLSGSATFEQAATLDVTLGTGGTSGSYTVLTATGGITDGGINNWSSECDHVTYAVNGNNLDVTYHGDSDPGRCGTEPPAVCIEDPELDLDGNCRVDLGDFAKFAVSWMECGFNVPSACGN